MIERQQLSRFGYRWHILFCTLLILFAQWLPAQHINGITSVATPYAFPSDPYPRLKKTEANWTCLVPYAFARIGQTELWYNVEHQWWGERPEGVEENIKLAQANGLKVCIKPQVYFSGNWPGDVDFETEAEWTTWETNYTAYIDQFIDLAIKHDVEMFCIGTEFKITETKRAKFWRSLIKDIRCRYTGLLTYSSNWDSFMEVPFWEELDYVGVSWYKPLTKATTPTERELRKAWKPKLKSLETFSRKTKKKILFTEYGYLSVDGCAGKTWELEKRVKTSPINETAQANAFQGLYTQLWEKEWWAGGFIWKWFPHGEGHEGYVERDYTPQDKKAEEVIREWFGKDY